MSDPTHLFLKTISSVTTHTPQEVSQYRHNIYPLFFPLSSLRKQGLKIHMLHDIQFESFYSTE